MTTNTVSQQSAVTKFIPAEAGKSGAGEGGQPSSPNPLHTPGPWKFRPHSSGDGAFVIYPPESNFGAVGEAYAYPRYVAENSRANAALMAAAPDLLAELRGMVADVQITAACMLDSVETHGTHGGWLHDESNRLFSALETARAAIAKAEGRP